MQYYLAFEMNSMQNNNPKPISVYKNAATESHCNVISVVFQLAKKKDLLSTQPYLGTKTSIKTK